jgi:hypothetical protein
MPFLLLFAFPLKESAVAVDFVFLAGAADFFGAAILVDWVILESRIFSCDFHYIPTNF